MAGLVAPGDLGARRPGVRSGGGACREAHRQQGQGADDAGTHRMRDALRPGWTRICAACSPLPKTTSDATAVAGRRQVGLLRARSSPSVTHRGRRCASERMAREKETALTATIPAATAERPGHPGVQHEDSAHQRAAEEGDDRGHSRVVRGGWSRLPTRARCQRRHGAGEHRGGHVRHLHLSDGRVAQADRSGHERDTRRTGPARGDGRGRAGNDCRNGGAAGLDQPLPPEACSGPDGSAGRADPRRRRRRERPRVRTGWR